MTTATAPNIDTNAPESEMLAAIPARLDALDALFVSLPDPNDEASPNARERAAIARNVVDARRRTLRNAADTVARLDSRIAPIRAWRDFLAELKREYQTAKGDFDSLSPEEQHARYRAESVVRDAIESLKVIDHGPEWIGDMAMMPDALSERIRARGILPLEHQRSVFAGRGGLFATEERLSDFEERRADPIGRIATELEQPVEVSRS